MVLNGVFWIEDGVLVGYSGKDSHVVIPDTVSSIADRAFDSNGFICSVTIPDTVTSIGEYAFYACGKLSKVIFPDSDLAIGRGAFGECRSLNTLTVSDTNRCMRVEGGVLYSFDGTKLLLCPVGRSERRFTVPFGVTHIGDGAFYSCGGLSDVAVDPAYRGKGYALQLQEFALEFCRSHYTNSSLLLDETY